MRRRRPVPAVLRRPLGRLRAGLRARARGPVSILRLWRVRLSDRGVGAVLMYHRVEPRLGDPAREFTPPLSCDAFAAQLEHLRRHYRVVAAADIQDAARRRRRGDRVPVALTFDDDTRSHVQWAAPLMAERGVTATFFLNGMALDAPRAYWWERLQAAHDAGRDWPDLLPPEVLAEARSVRGDDEPLDAYAVTEAVERMSPEARGGLSETWCEMVGGDPPDAGLRAADVRALAAQGFTIGFHGHNHEPMSLLDDRTLDRELDGRPELSQASGQDVAVIAYPHGRTNATVAQAARAHGWQVGFTCVPEAVTDGSDPLLLGRVDGWAPSVDIVAASLVRALRDASGRS